jgi:DsbC/DsbD-like thiol-disulfide interchange protein
MRSLWAPFWLLLACTSLCAQPPEAKHARVELIAENTGVTPGQKLLLGVHFQLEKDWHLYWVNPGDSGQPPVIRWQLPASFSAEPVQWPRPGKMKSSQSADYVYKDDLLLMVPVKVAPSVSSSSQLNIGANVNWLICREVCIADQAQLHLALPVSSTPAVDTRYRQLFDQARKLLPRTWPAAWKATAISRKDDFVLSIETGKTLREAEFFPLEFSQIENGAPQILNPTPRGAKMTLKKSDQLLKPVSKLKGVVVLKDGIAYELSAPVVAHGSIK